MKVLLHLGWLAFCALPLLINAQPSAENGGPYVKHTFQSPETNLTSKGEGRKLNLGLSSRFHSHSEFPGAGLTPTLDIYYEKFALQISPFAPRFYVGMSADIMDFKKLRIKERECLHLIGFLGYTRSNDDAKPWLGLSPYPDVDAIQLGTGFRFTFPDRAFITAGLSMDYTAYRQEFEVLYPRTLRGTTLNAFVGLGFAIFPMHQISN